MLTLAGDANLTFKNCSAKGGGAVRLSGEGWKQCLEPGEMLLCFLFRGTTRVMEALNLDVPDRKLGSMVGKWVIYNLDTYTWGIFLGV